jgi:hypothetical protein
MKITVTGHRPPKGGLTYDYKGPGVQHPRNELEGVLNLNKPELVYIGMAIGFDIIVAITCYKRGIPYVAVIPFVGQERKWPAESAKLYFFLLKNAKYIHITDLNKDCSYDEYKKLKVTMDTTSIFGVALLMDKRNQWQTDQLTGDEDFLLSFHDGSPGGTNNCINYAKSKGKKIINIQPL